MKNMIAEQTFVCHEEIKSRKQAIAIGLSKARKKGVRVPKKKK